MSSHPITIIGGGIAGLALGIRLRQLDIPVVLWESGKYPRHKVCGEFISGKGQNVLSTLGVNDALISGGARLARTIAFFSEKKASGVRDLPQPALCISRFKLDALLARHFCLLGGQLKQESRWSDPFTRGVVRTTGREPVPVVEGWRWFGIKAHARNISLEADLEMHFTSGGYVGLCRLDDQWVNVCALFRSENPVPDLRTRWQSWLGGRQGSPLAQRTKMAEYDDASFSSTAALYMSKEPFNATEEFRLGDSLGLIPPVTGNGMSLALESAALAAEPLFEFSRGVISWEEARRQAYRQCRKSFSSRLRRAYWLQKLLLQPGARECLFFTTAKYFPVWRILFSSTR